MGKKDEAKWNGKERGRLKKEKDVKNEADNLKKDIENSQQLNMI